MSRSRITFCCIAVSAVAIWLHRRNSTSTAVHCWNDVLENKKHCIPKCNNGSFALSGMTECKKWLTCADDVQTKNVIVKSIVKTVYLAEWDGFTIVKSDLSSPEFEKDFTENLKMHMLFAQNPLIVQFLGYCNHSIYTQFHKLGSALDFHNHLSHLLASYNTATLRFQFCIYYAAILAFLHSHPSGVHVMCDSNTLEKTLSQYLLTNNLKLVLNDMDAVPIVNNNGVICGTKQLNGTFVAPEQLWPDKLKSFSFKKMIPYNEKSDVWKMPDVCHWFLGKSSETDIIKFKLFKIHKSCKSTDPVKRPSAQLVLESYKEIESHM